jgi:hypothetical protein
VAGNTFFPTSQYLFPLTRHKLNGTSKGQNTRLVHDMFAFLVFLDGVCNLRRTFKQYMGNIQFRSMRGSAQPTRARANNGNINDSISHWMEPHFYEKPPTHGFRILLYYFGKTRESFANTRNPLAQHNSVLCPTTHQENPLFATKHQVVAIVRELSCPTAAMPHYQNRIFGGIRFVFSRNSCSKNGVGKVNVNGFTFFQIPESLVTQFTQFKSGLS